MKKVLIINHGLASGGTDSFVVNLAKGLVRDQYEVKMALAVDPESGMQFRENEVLDMGVSVYKLSDLDGIKKIIRYMMRLYRLMKNEEPDIVHANMDLFNGINMFVAWAAGVPVRVCHSHTSKSQYEEKSGKHFLARIYRACCRKMIWQFSNRRCGCSQVAMDYLYQEKWKKDRYSCLIFNGIDIDSFANATRVELPFEDKGKELILATVGRLTPEKNPFFTVNLMRELCEQGKRVSLIWIGSGELEQQIKDQVEEYGLSSCIHMLGNRKDVNRVLKNADLFLLPSLFEGLPIALLEAQAAGLSCLVSENITKQVDAGLCCFLPIDRGAIPWIEAINNFIEGKMQLTVDSEILARFSLGHMVSEIERMYV